MTSTIAFASGKRSLLLLRLADVARDALRVSRSAPMILLVRRFESLLATCGENR